MNNITILPPQKVEYHEEDASRGIVEVVGCYPGYGATLGNALRRVLLSSLEGAAATSIKIEGVQHEFSTLENIREDIVQVLLNLKRVRFQLEGEESVKVSLSAKGEKVITAGDIKTPTGVKVVNPEHILVTLTDKKAKFEAEIEVKRGLGYIPVEQQDRPEKEIGVIAVDAIFTPVRRVNFTVDNVRVGKRTDYERIRFEIETDGSISSKEAFERASQILVGQFSSFIEEKKVIEEEKE
jgi:DNA-directed RNA polymerase subunit alpha